MIDLTRFTSQSTYDATQAYLEQKRKERESRQQAAVFAPPPPVTPTGPAPYIEPMQQQAEEQKPFIQNAFEMIGRPEAALRGALTAPARNMNPVEGFMQGIQGENVPGYSESLGVPGVVEKAASFVLDPLNLIPFGKFVTGGRAAVGAIRAAGHGRHLPPPSAMPQIAPGHVRLYRGADDYGPVPEMIRNSYGDLVQNSDFHSEKGRWFSTDKDVATFFNAGKGQPFYIDVPQAIADAAIQADTAFNETGRLLPRELAERATRLTNTFPPPSAITALPRVDVPTAIQEGTRTTPWELGRKAISAVPEVNIGPIHIPKLADIISPNLSARSGSIKAVMNGYDKSVDNASQMATIMTAGATGGRKLLSEITENGEIVLTDGRAIGAADVAENLSMYGKLLPPEDVTTLSNLVGLFRDVQTAGREGAPVLAQYDDLVGRIGKLYGDDTAERFRIPQQLQRGGRDVFPRYTRHEVTGDVKFMGPGHKTGLNERVFGEQQQGIEAGYKYIGPIEAAQQRLTDHAIQMANMEALIELHPYIKAVGEAASHTPSSAFHPLMPGKGVPRDSGLEELSESGMLKGLWASPEDAAKIRERFGREEAFRQGGGASRLVGIGADANGLVRTIQSSGDLSPWFLQLLPTLVTNPARGMAAMYMSAKAMVRPRQHDEMIGSAWAQDILQRAPGLSIGKTGAAGEAFEALKPGGLGQKLPNAPVIGGVIQRSQAAFETAGDFARLAGASAMLPSAEKAGKVAEMVDFLNHSTGSFSTRGIGVNPTQRGIESWMMFAPRYTRASFALVGDIGGGSLAGREAANALGSMLLFGVGGYNAFAKLIGQEPELDPRRANFLTIETVGGERVGVGTQFRSLLQLLGKIQAQVEGKDDLPRSRTPLTTGRKLTLDDLSDENPLIRFLRGKSSPVGGAFWDIMDGETYMGKSLAGINPLAYAGTKMLPFAIGGFLEETGILEGQPDWKGGGPASGAAAEFVGLRSFPEQRGDVQDDVTREMFPGKTYDQLDRIQRAQVQSSERMKAIPAREGKDFALDRESGQVYEQYRTKLEAIAARVESGGQDAITTRQFRDELHKLQQERRTLVKDLERRYPDQVRAPRTKEDQAEDEYFRLLSEPDVTGRVNYEAAESYLAGLPPTTKTYIEHGLQQSTERLGPKAKALVRELYAARDRLERYWEVQETEFKRAGFWDEWQAASGPERTQLTQDRRYKQAQRRVDIARQRIRMREPEIDNALVRFGYVSKGIRDRRR